MYFWVIFMYWNQTEIWKTSLKILLSSSRAFSLSTPMENSAVCQLKGFFNVYPCGQQWGYMEKSYKKLQNATNIAYLPELTILLVWFWWMVMSKLSRKPQEKVHLPKFLVQRTKHLPRLHWMVLFLGLLDQRDYLCTY